jgi:hypothetical protein
MSPLGKRSWWLVGRGDQLLVRLGKVPIGDLTDLREKRVRPGAVTWIAAVATLAVAVSVPFAVGRLNGAGWIGVGLALAVPLTVFATTLLTRPYHLRATYRGRTIRRLPNATKREFDEIRRAVSYKPWWHDAPPWLVAQRSGRWTSPANRTLTANRYGDDAADVATRRDESSSEMPAYGPMDYGSAFHDPGSGHYISPSF